MKSVNASIAVGMSMFALSACAVDTTTPADHELSATSAQALEMTTFPSSLEDEHMSWHMGGRRYAAGQPGSGTEFFDFHHDFMRRALLWYQSQAFDPKLVAAWSEIPTVLKDARYGWSASLADAERRILTNTPAFAGDDDLGIFIESTIHNWIHGAVAQAFNEPIVGTLRSPRSTYFYQIHGLVDAWRQRLPKAPTCSTSVECGAGGVGVNCLSETGPGDMVFERTDSGGTTVWATIPASVAMNQYNYAVDHPTSTGTVAYRVCTSDAVHRYCTPDMPAQLPAPACPPPLHCPRGTHSCDGTKCIPLAVFCE